MRRVWGFGAPLAALAALAMPVAAMMPRQLTESVPAARPSKKRKAPWGAGRNKSIRSRGAQAPRRKRPNRLHISRRVRRKHRRAA